MIPYQLAILSWLVIGTLIMMQRDGARAVTLNFMLAVMVLPSGVAIDLPVIPGLYKTSVALVSALIGTILFHPHVISRLRFRWYDALILVIFAFTILTSLTNGYGLYDGISSFIDDFLYIAVLFSLFRMHVATPRDLRSMLLTFVWCSVFYLPFAVWEFRMSPQIHTTLYGFFQHVFAQHYRYGFWRPVVCFHHALSLGRFFAFCAFLAMLPLRNALARQVPFGRWVFLAPLLGTFLSMSFSPVLMFFAYSGLYLVCRKGKFLWAIYVAPVLAYIVVTLIFLGMNPMNLAVDFFAAISENRAASLQYRIDAWEEYRENIVQNPVFGWGGWGAGRITGRATDSAFLIRSLSKGIVGASILYLFYFIHLSVAKDMVRRARGAPFFGDCLAIACIAPMALALNSIDQGIGQQTAFVFAVITSVHMYLVRAGTMRFAAARTMPTAPEQRSHRPMHRPARAARMALRAKRARDRGESTWAP